MNILFDGVSNIFTSLFTSVDKAGNAKLVSIYARIFLVSLVIPFGVIPIIIFLFFDPVTLLYVYVIGGYTVALIVSRGRWYLPVILTVPSFIMLALIIIAMWYTIN